MIQSSTSRRDAHTARVMLRMIQQRRHTSAESARERIMAMMADLDIVILHLPEDPPNTIIDEIERVVVTLRTSDQCLSDGNSASGMQSLDLAKARLDRLAEMLMPPEDPDHPDTDEE